jgi:hypothetical protein
VALNLIFSEAFFFGDDGASGSFLSGESAELKSIPIKRFFYFFQP